MAESGVPRAAYNVEEVAESLSLSARFVRELLATGKIRSFKIGRRRLVSAGELERIVQEGIECQR